MKYTLNTLLLTIALFSFITGIFITTELSSRCISFATAVACIAAMFSQKEYRYILASIALILIVVSFFI